MWTSVVRSLTDSTFKMSVFRRNINRSKDAITENKRCHTCSATNDEILVEKLGPVTTIGINRPQKRNCINMATANKLSRAVLEFEEDDSALVGILHGIGGNFCAGYDLEELSGFDSNVGLINEAGHGPMGPTRRVIKKPMVAAVSGYAVAGGMELALMCDLRVMEETAIMGVFCRRFGVPLLDGGTVRLQALVGLSRALDLILTGRAIKAQEAFEWGLANRLVACGTGLGQAINLATSLVKFPQECLRADRVSVYNSAFNASSVEEALEFEQHNATAAVLQESIAGAKQFISGVGRHGKFYNVTDKKQTEPVRSKI